LKFEIKAFTELKGTGKLVFFFKYNQQDATLHNSFISAKCSTCLSWFLHPSSGAQKLYVQHLVFVKPLLLPFAVVEDLELQFQLQQIPGAVRIVFELLMMGGGTA
jgi:hypothetical protein